jgi:hypothetical protein
LKLSGLEAVALVLAEEVQGEVEPGTKLFGVEALVQLMPIASASPTGEDAREGESQN